MDGAVISAVDLIKGIAVCSGMEPIDVEGATGTIKTNFDGKSPGRCTGFPGRKGLCLYSSEAPDECSHQGSMAEKIESLELIDWKVTAPLIDYLNSTGEDYRVLILPDHPTPVSIRTHSAEPVPYVLYDSRKDSGQRENRYSEHPDAQERTILRTDIS